MAKKITFVLEITYHLIAPVNRSDTTTQQFIREYITPYFYLTKRVHNFQEKLINYWRQETVDEEGKLEQKEEK